MKEGKIIAVGKDAIDEKEKILLFFGDKATEGLRRYSIIQEISDPQAITIKPGDQIAFDQKSYVVTFVGNIANQNLHSLQHVTFVFDTVPETNVIANGIYLAPDELPEIAVGMTVTYP
ncbi:PTS glucitol/sorbitol transporter subunit IIA [Enterococcus mediterraneensis]|uniref:PTS glucitol/sorbitol transporter subunit IIA n=1 Tax=Enterococcus mediterraneensis TaxID=2364791 RepID=UPI000F04CF91|nr:PTS glucitol/sorbitol transporter subunit IIA [Enterococcus mediterraneensis]